MKRKHTAYDLESYPLKCELCETELKNSAENERATGNPLIH